MTRHHTPGYRPVRAHNVQVGFSTWGWGTLANLTTMYRTTPAQVFAANRRVHHATHGDIERFTNHIETEPDATFNLPIRPEERAQHCKRVPADSLTAICERENPLREAAHLPPVTPQFLWNLSLNAPFRVASVKLASDERGARLAVADPVGSFHDDVHPVYIPEQIGAIQSALRAQPSGTISLDPITPWILQLRQRLEAFEIDLNSLENYTLQIEREAAGATQETAWVTLLERYANLLEKNRLTAGSEGYQVNLPSYQPLLDKLLALKTQAVEDMVKHPVEREGGALLDARSFYATVVKDFLHTDAAVAGLVHQLHTEGSSTSLGPQTLEWYCRSSERAVQLLGPLREGEELFAALENQMVEGASENTASTSAALNTFNTLAQIAPVFVGNAPGPANLTVSTLQWLSYRKLAKISRTSESVVDDVKLIWRLRRVFADVPRAEANALREALRQRGTCERVARDVTGEFHTGPLANSVVLICTAVCFWSGLQSSSTADVPAALMNVASGMTGGSSAAAQLLIPIFERRGMALSLETAQVWGEVGGRACALIAIASAAWGLYQYLKAPHPDGINYWQVSSYVLAIVGGLITLGAYLEMVPFGQLIGTFLMLAGVVTAIIADPNAAREWWNGPVKTFLKKTIEKFESGSHYRHISRHSPELRTAVDQAKTAIDALSHNCHFYGHQSSMTTQALLRDLVQLGLEADQAKVMFREVSTEPILGW